MLSVGGLRNRVRRWLVYYHLENHILFSCDYLVDNFWLSVNRMLFVYSVYICTFINLGLLIISCAFTAILSMVPYL